MIETLLFFVAIFGFLGLKKWLLSGWGTKFDMDISRSKSQVTFTNTYIAHTPPPAN